MNPLSIVVIMKNEEAHLERFLSNIENRLDLRLFQLVLVDTGSTDASLEIAKKHGITPVSFKWINDFSAARNFAATQALNDWLLVLDCDEFIEAFDMYSLEGLMEDIHNTGLITRKNIFDNNGNECCFEEFIPRIYNRTCYHFEGTIHEQLCLITSDDKYNFPRLSCGITALHTGYIGTAEDIRKKALRNKELLLLSLEKSPGDPYIYFQLGQACHSLNEENEAAEYYAKGLSFDVDEKLQYVNMMVIAYGYALLNTGREREALSFENIYGVFSTTADFVCLMGLIYLKNELLPQAIREFEQALQISKEYTTGSGSFIPAYNLGIIYEISGDTKKAKAYYDLCGSFKPALLRKSQL